MQKLKMVTKHQVKLLQDEMD